MLHRSNTFFRPACIAICAGILLVGLWPFNFWPENKVRWLKDENGIQFYGKSMIYSERETDNAPAGQPSSIPFKSITIEILVRPDREAFRYPAYIFSLNDTRTSEAISLQQWQSNLGIQRRISDPDKRWIYRNTGLKDVLQKGRKRLLSITSDDKGTSIFVDGMLARTDPRFSLLSSQNRTTSFDLLVLGNSVTGKQYWTGSLLGLAIYDRALSHEPIAQHFYNWSQGETPSFMNEEALIAFYPFDERSGNRAYDHMGRHHLFIPPRFEALQKTILTPPWQDLKLNRSYLTDILTNILGFIPLGFFFSAFLSTRKPRSIYQLLFLSVLLAGSMSLSIELLQVYLPTRNSQLMDVITNLLGTVIGAILFSRNRKSFDVSRPIVSSQ